MLKVLHTDKQNQWEEESGEAWRKKKKVMNMCSRHSELRGGNNCGTAEEVSQLVRCHA